MTTEERWDLLHKAKLCGRCLDKETVVGSKSQLFSHFKNCKGPKSSYKCEAESCKYHMWVCKGHKERNYAGSLTEIEREGSNFRTV